MPYEDHPLPAAFHVEPIVPLKHGRGNPPRKQKGAVAKITRDVKQGILEGAIAFGSDGEGTGGLTGYFEMCAAKFPKAYMHLLGKLMPIQLHGEGLSGPSITSVNIISVPTDNYLSAEDMARLRGQTQTIEHVPPSEPLKPIEPIEPPPPVTIENLKAELRSMGHERLLELARALNVGE